jgi:hypothetical protein
MEVALKMNREDLEHLSDDAYTEIINLFRDSLEEVGENPADYSFENVSVTCNLKK